MVDLHELRNIIYAMATIQLLVTALVIINIDSVEKRLTRLIQRASLQSDSEFSTESTPEEL